MSLRHPYGVLFVPTKPTPLFPGGLRLYRGWCECGWRGALVPDEADAAREAADHAGVAELVPVKIPRRRGPIQTERLFEGDGVERPL